jgi:3-methylfumaryl-CoA hydratase
VGAIGPASVLVDPFPASVLALILGRDPIWSTGDDLPPGWHRLYQRELVPAGELGVDGAQASAAGPAGLPVRVHGGVSWRFEHPVRIGDRLSWSTEQLSRSERVGRSGPLVIARDRTTFRAEGRIAVVEESVSIYKGLGGPLAAPSADRPAARNPLLRISLSDVDLFRYAAVTFNAHRVHLDRAWATTVEPYPDLLVQGPLLALILLEGLRRSGVSPTWAEVRNVGPAFAGDELRVEVDDGGLALVSDRGGEVATLRWS